MTFTEKEGDVFSIADNAPKSPPASENNPPKLSSGDQITFAADLLDASGADVGDLGVVCIIIESTNGTFDDARAQCTATAEIPGGTLTLTAGGKTFGETTHGAIVGGTGDCEGATGGFTSETTGNDQPDTDTFHFRFPK